MTAWSLSEGRGAAQRSIWLLHHKNSAMRGWNEALRLGQRRLADRGRVQQRRELLGELLY